jgi:hypothetical protein
VHNATRQKKAMGANRKTIQIRNLNLHFMSNNKDHSGEGGNDKTKTKNKGESQQSHQKGAPSVSHQDTGKHTKDKSHGADENSTKKGANSI